MSVSLIDGHIDDDVLMTDEQIIKTLECGIIIRGRDVINLINRQKAEIENYSRNNRSLTEAVMEMQKTVKNQSAEIERLSAKSFEHNVTKLFDKYKAHIKADAIKEFAKRLKETANSRIYRKDVVYIVEIDNLINEMAGDAE